MKKLTLGTPSELIAAIPYLIGFHPQDSLVAVATKESHLVFVMRADLPERDATPSAVRTGVLGFAMVIAEKSFEDLVLIGYGEAARAAPGIRALSRCLNLAGIAVMDEFRVTEGRYWSYSCRNPACCPAEGKPCPAPASVPAVELILAGRTALPSRRDLERLLAPVLGDERRAMCHAEARATERLLDLRSEVATRTEQPGAYDQVVRGVGRTAVRAAEKRYSEGGRLTDDELAWLMLFLGDSRIRDYAWVRSGLAEWHFELWADVVRRANPERVAPPASVLAFVAWRSGRGALASIAVDRALAADPDYLLALTMGEVLCSGLEPSVVDGWPAIDGHDPFPELLEGRS